MTSEAEAHKQRVLELWAKQISHSEKCFEGAIKLTHERMWAIYAAMKNSDMPIGSPIYDKYLLEMQKILDLLIGVAKELIIERKGECDE